MSLNNNNIILAARPNGLPGKECWQLVSSDIPPIPERHLLVKVRHISLDPAMRAWMTV